ncbi:hypothetical protein [Ruegeria sp. HKCCA0370]|uniref:hypothetical protein n=1 Tax=Ruegeria sp. HKCCA0370 TaxID=2682995 RepID=UPI0014886EF8|nr:hypothetical protein [Ruegeria sp. HKCCA0370]
MSRMDHSIILGAQQPNFSNALAQGQALRMREDQMADQNALRGLFQTHGPGILAGNQASMNVLARYDPVMASEIQGQHQVQAQRRQVQAHLSAEERRNAEAHVAKMNVAERAAKAERIQMGLKAAYGAQTPEEWDAIVQQFGSPDLVGEFANKEAHVRRHMEFADILKAQEPPKPQSSPGKVQADINAGFLPAGTELRSPQVVVNTGNNAGERPIVDKPPKGFQRVWDENSQTYVDKPIPGSDVSQERNSAGRKVELAASDYRRKSDIVNSNIDNAIASIEENGRWVAGYGSLLSGLPESAARDFQATIDTIKANLGFEELQAMKDASPTGGALGQVTEREIAFLQAIQGNLDAAQSPERLLSVLKEIKKRRAEFAAERQAIMAKDQTAAQAADLSQQVRNLPDFANMSDDELNAWIQENGNE